MRPLKDPILQTYTFEELAYEFYAHGEYQDAKEERIEQENDKIDKKAHEEASNWADEMEAMEAMEAAEAEQDPSKDPENIAWMEEQMEAAKAIYGDNFGEDISEDFE